MTFEEALAAVRTCVEDLSRESVTANIAAFQDSLIAMLAHRGVLSIDDVRATIKGAARRS